MDCYYKPSCHYKWFAASYKDLIGCFATIKNLKTILNYATFSPIIPHNSHSDLEIAIKVANVSILLSGKTIVDQANLYIKDGEFIAIIGESGSGKSTLAKALSGLLEYDGTISVSEKTKCVRYLSQEAELFDLDLVLNVAFSESPDCALVEKSLQDAGFTKEDIESIGTRSLGEHGRNVSGGQRQRIGLARMLYHQADILVLDEPTASLDEKTAARVIETICLIAKTKTVILVTHDLKFAASANRIYKMESGILSQEIPEDLVIKLMTSDRANTRKDRIAKLPVPSKSSGSIE